MTQNRRVAFTDFEARTALITGGGRGIGRAIALGLAARGARVAISARSRAQLEETVDRIQSAGGDVVMLPADLVRPNAATELAAEATAALGRVDILVNNAAVLGPIGDLGRLDMREYADAIMLDVVAPAALMNELVPGMVRRGWGRVATISSGAAVPPGMTGANAYSTAKAAVESQALGFASEVDGTGVTINAYRPGRVDTAMQAAVRAQSNGARGAELQQRFIRWHEAGELLTPAQSAEALIDLLATEENGQVWRYRA